MTMSFVVKLGHIFLSGLLISRVLTRILTVAGGDLRAEGPNLSAEGAKSSRGVRGHAPPENFKN